MPVRPRPCAYGAALSPGPCIQHTFNLDIQSMSENHLATLDAVPPFQAACMWSHTVRRSLLPLLQLSAITALPCHARETTDATCHVPVFTGQSSCKFYQAFYLHSQRLYCFLAP